MMSSDVEQLGLETTVSSDDAGVTLGGAAGDGGRLSAGTKLGRYEIVEFIGGGGMGWVYRAKDAELEREVAIKVVQPTVAGSKGRDRLLTEARAMAKLRHRAVVPVHDVGEYAGGVYVAMALVKGGTLHDWMHAEPRPWRQVVARFLEAGRGLVAAHAAGIVHRDFKPRNVLMGEGGEVLVADFGIASASVEVGEGDGTGAGAREATSIVGTPAYMAPEQAAGQAVDARADQYSFCVSLWEGLHGQRPQEAETRTQGALLAGATAAPKSRRRVPGWLTEAIARGFAPAPEKRWPTLAALLDRLERGLGRRRRYFVIAAAAGAVAAIVLGLLLKHDAAPARSIDPCPPPRTQLDVVWGAAQRQAVIDAFNRVDAKFEPEVLDRILPRLDSYVEAWASAARNNCRATHVEHRQSDVAQDARTACLDARLRDFGGLVEVFRQADRPTVKRAIELVDALPGLEPCDDAVAAAAAEALPADPALRARGRTLRERMTLARVAARRLDKDALERARQNASDAEALGFAPIRAVALADLATVQLKLRHDAEATLRRLVDAAASAKDDVRLALGWGQLVFALIQQGRMDEAKALEPVALAAQQRVAGDREVEYAVGIALAARAANMSEFELATQRYRRCVDVATSSGERANALQELGTVLAALGRVAEARQAVNEALELAREAYGEHHPNFFWYLHARQFVLQTSSDPGDVAQVERDLAQMLELALDEFGEVHPNTVDTLYMWAQFDLNRDRWDSAEQHARRGLEILEQIDVPLIKTSLLNVLGDVQAHRGGLAAARRTYEEGLRLADAISGRVSEQYAGLATSLGHEFVQARDCATGERYLKQAVAAYREMGSPQWGGPQRDLAVCAARAGRAAVAVRLIEEALAGCAAGQCDDNELAGLYRSLGELLLRKDRPRAHALLSSARATYLKAGRQAEVDAIDRLMLVSESGDAKP